MTGRIIQLGVVEPSHIVFEGLNTILSRSTHPYLLHRFQSLAEVLLFKQIDNLLALLVNPAIVSANPKDFHQLKRSYPALAHIGIIYTFYSPEQTKPLDGLILITDGIEQIACTVQRLVTTPYSCEADDSTQHISEREREVLVEMVSGLSNKEIADRLSISIHTVVTHRKNIAKKTGIRSQAGLTIYAITNRIVSLDSVG